MLDLTCAPPLSLPVPVPLTILDNGERSRERGRGGEDRRGRREKREISERGGQGWENKEVERGGGKAEQETFLPIGCLSILQYVMEMSVQFLFTYPL